VNGFAAQALALDAFIAGVAIHCLLRQLGRLLGHLFLQRLAPDFASFIAQVLVPKTVHAGQYPTSFLSH